MASWPGENLIETLEQSARRVLRLQALFALALILVILLLAVIISGPATLTTLGFERAKSAAFGSLLGILATLVAARSVKKSSGAVAKSTESGPLMGMFPIYAGLLFKLLIVAGGTFFGLVHLGLGPLYVVLGYIAMQAGYMWVAARPIS